MDVKQIQVMLDTIDEDSELQHVWTKPMGEVGDKRRFATTLYFRQNGVKIEIPLEHFKDIPEETEEAKVDLHKVKDNTMTQKLGNFFNKQV